MKASVIILTWNGMTYIEACLDAVLAQDGVDFEIIVVDNASTDGTVEFVAERYPQVRLIRNERNLGFAAGNNIGMRAATGDVLVLLNQDTEVHPGWLAALVDMVADPQIGLVGCKLLYPNGTIQHAGGHIVDARGSARHIGRGEVDTGQYDAVQDVDFVTGAALALTRATLARIDLLDEGFTPAYYEDTDWCYRARMAGLRVVYCPQAVATHDESISSETESYAHLASFHAGRLRFLFKHQSLEDLQTAFMTAESTGVRNLGPGGELEALREAWLKTLLSLPDIVQFRIRYIAPDADPHAMREALLQIALALRELCAKDAPLYDLHTPLEADEAWASQLTSLHQKWQVTPQPLRSDVPFIGPGIAAFREAWLRVATRWYVEPLVAQQRAFNATTTQLMDQIAHYLHAMQQMADNITRAQQENAQHVRELNTLLSELLRLQMRVAELETQLEQRSENT